MMGRETMRVLTYKGRFHTPEKYRELRFDMFRLEFETSFQEFVDWADPLVNVNNNPDRQEVLARLKRGLMRNWSD